MVLIKHNIKMISLKRKSLATEDSVLLQHLYSHIECHLRTEYNVVLGSESCIQTAADRIGHVHIGAVGGRMWMLALILAD